MKNKPIIMWNDDLLRKGSVFVVAKFSSNYFNQKCVMTVGYILCETILISACKNSMNFTHENVL